MPNMIDNIAANEIILVVQDTLKSGHMNPPHLQKMMDMISGVANYSLMDQNRQGVIKGLFIREISKYSNGTSDYSIDLNDIISVFWESVFKYLPKAASSGTIVKTRGQDQDLDKMIQLDRKTKCNPIYYLRNMGIMGVRNYINGVYRKSLIQVCDNCCNTSLINSTEISSIICPKCGSQNTTRHWPHGNTVYKTPKSRICLDCKAVWSRTFAKTCNQCGSKNVRVENRYCPVSDKIDRIHSDTESKTDPKNDPEIDYIVGELAKCLVTRNGRSKTNEIFDLLLNLDKSDICLKCTNLAPKVCEQMCGDFAHNGQCKHKLIPDPHTSCGSDKFSLEKCISYSRKIGEFYGCSPSLVARRVKKIRKCLINYVIKHSSNDSCSALLRLLRKGDMLNL